ncbi:hypothetical protein EON65_18055 [archaeon]|nr:MAG: hypothetical protein EON65_18055 [archaeon]
MEALEDSATATSNTNTASSSGNAHPLNLAPKLEAHADKCKEPMLWGKEHQGGWWICKDPLTHSTNSNCLVYSYGLGKSLPLYHIYRCELTIGLCLCVYFRIGADWSFDNAAEEAGCEVHGFDPSGPLWRSVRMLCLCIYALELSYAYVHAYFLTHTHTHIRIQQPQPHTITILHTSSQPPQGMYGRGYEDIDYSISYPSEHKHFHNWGIGAADQVTYPPHTIPQDWPGLGDPPMSFSNPEPWETRSVQFSIASLGHGNRTLSVLKIDVEGKCGYYWGHGDMVYLGLVLGMFRCLGMCGCV